MMNKADLPKLNLNAGRNDFEGDVPEAVIKRRNENLAKVQAQQEALHEQNGHQETQVPSGSQTERRGRAGRKYTELNIPSQQIPFTARDPTSLHTDYDVHPNLAPGRPRLSSITNNDGHNIAKQTVSSADLTSAGRQPKKILQPLGMSPQSKVGSLPAEPMGMPSSWLDSPRQLVPNNQIGAGGMWDNNAQPKDGYRRGKGLGGPGNKGGGGGPAPLPIPAGHYFVAKQSKYSSDNDGKASPRVDFEEKISLPKGPPVFRENGAASKAYERASRLSFKEPQPQMELSQEDMNNGITPAMAIQYKGSQLTDTEMSEILDYQTVYFFGDKDVKVKTDINKPNKGYDDERGDYRVQMGDHLGFRFELLENLGKGSFGAVFKCKDHKNGSITAVKIIRNKKRFQQQARIEVKILNKLCNDAGARANCIQIYETFDFRGHTCLVFPLYGLNLYEYLKVKGFRGCSLPFVRQVAIQLLDCLGYLARHNIVHCDLKPENILLRNEQKAQIVVIDFGSSCYVKETIYTYIQSRFYRSPEVILGLEYGLPIDLWSFACIIPELYTAYPLFPGENENDQMACISELIGQPPMHLVNRSTRRKQLFHDSGELRIQPSPRGKIRTPNSRTFDDIRGNRAGDPMFTSFLQRCIRWDPEDRPTPDQLMSHPWIDGSASLPSAMSNETRYKESRSRIFNRLG